MGKITFEAIGNKVYRVDGSDRVLLCTVSREMLSPGAAAAEIASALNATR